MRVTIILMVSRSECLDLVKENLDNLDLGDHEVELLVMVDNSHVAMAGIVDEEKYGEVTIQNTGNIKPPIDQIPTTRDRIANARNESRELVGDTDFVFSFEDDGVVPKDALLKLLDDYQAQTRPGQKVGLVSGIQVGRHGRKMLGAWYADSMQFPTEVISLGKNEITTPLAEVDGAGFYCYLTPTKLYKRARYGWHEPVGPDVYYGFWLRMQGYVNYVDQGLVVGHRNPAGDVLTPDNQTVVKVKFFMNKNGQWLNDLVHPKVLE